MEAKREGPVEDVGEGLEGVGGGGEVEEEDGCDGLDVKISTYPSKSV